MGNIPGGGSGPGWSPRRCNKPVAITTSAIEEMRMYMPKQLVPNFCGSSLYDNCNGEFSAKSGEYVIKVGNPYYLKELEAIDKGVRYF